MSTLGATITDDTLIQRCVAGETQAWRELHRAYLDVVVRVLTRLGVPPTEVDDAAQEVFVQVFRALGAFERRAGLRTWIYRIAVNQAGGYRRSRVPRFLRWLTGETLEAAAITGLDLSDSEATRRVRQALQRLKPAHRVPLVLYEFEGLSGEQIAQITASPVATVWRRLHYARREFESWLREGPMEGKAR